MKLTAALLALTVALALFSVCRDTSRQTWASGG
jgi:hypothetical protein